MAASNDNENELDAKLEAAVKRARSDPDRRRSVSIRGTTYAKLKAYCEANSVTMSSVVERLLTDVIGTGDESPPEPPRSESPHDV